MFEIGEIVSLTSGCYLVTDDVGIIMSIPTRVYKGEFNLYQVRVLNKLSGNYLTLSYYENEISKLKGEC